MNRQGEAPARSTVLATSIWFIPARVHPKRILAVTGVGAQASTKREIIALHSLGIAKQVRATMGFLGDLLDGATKVDIDNTDAILFN